MKTTYPINNERKNAAKDIISEKASKTYRKEIDGLRAVAVIAVIINHFNQDLLPGGFLGVDIFFVISGYVITKSLQRQKSSNLRQLLAGFYERRIKRLFPALAICLLITSLAVAVVNPQPLQSLRTALTATIGASNIYLIKNSTNYFAQSAELNPFLHTWSLAVEEQFYLVYPILFWIFTRQQKPEKSLGYLPLILCILSGLSLAGAVGMQTKSPDTAYFSMPFRFWEMAAGCLLCSNIFTKLTTKLETNFSRILCYASVILLFILFTISKTYIIPTTISTVIFTSIFIVTGESKNLLTQFLCHKWSVYIGALSYSLYLWHWPILSIGRWTVGVSNNTVIPLTLAIILTAVISYHCIEQPLRQKKWGKTHKNGIMKGAAAIALTGVGIFGISKNYSVLYRATNSTSTNQNLLETPLHWKDKDSKFADTIENCHIEDDSDLSQARLEQCFKKQSDDTLPRAYVIGDSHAVNHYFGIKKGLLGFDVRLYTAGWGCGYIPQETADKIAKFKCNKYMPLVDEYLANESNNNDLVFIGMRWVHKKLDVKGIEKKIDTLAKELKPRGVKIIILDDVPELPDTSLCTARWYRPGAKSNPLCQKTIVQVDSELSGLSHLGKLLEKNNSNVSFLRLRDAFCPEGICSVFDGKKPLYIDEGHLTDAASKRNSVLINKHVQSLNNKT